MCTFSWYIIHIITTETQFFGMWHHMVWCKFSHILEELFTSILYPEDLKQWQSTRIYGVTSQRSIIIISPNTYMYLVCIIACTCLKEHTLQITSLSTILHQLGYRVLVHATFLSTAQLMFYGPPLALKQHFPHLLHLWVLYDPQNKQQ